MISDPGRAGWLQLTLTPGLGSATLRKLLTQFGLPEKVLAAGRVNLARFASARVRQEMESEAVASAVEHALAWLEQPGNAIVTFADAAYPKLLLEIPDPPAILYYRGQTDLLNRPALAVVGSRNATGQGNSNSEQFARSFSKAGLTIVSGLAQGMNAAAHRGGLAGKGSTIAVLGTGVDVIYPRINADPGAEIAARGLLLSEFPHGTKALAHNFPHRSRAGARDLRRAGLDPFAIVEGLPCADQNQRQARRFGRRRPFGTVCISPRRARIQPQRGEYRSGIGDQGRCRRTAARLHGI